MTLNIDNFFDPIHIPVLNEESYKMLPTLIGFVDRFAKCSNLSLYIIDYKNQEFVYVSENKLFLCGYSAADVKEMGYSFYKKVVSNEDLEFLSEINKVGFQFFYQQPLEKRDQYVIEYDFDLCHVNRQKTRINHRLIPFCITSNGDIWLALCIVSMSFNKNTDSHYARVATIRNIYTREEFSYSLKTKTWDRQLQHELTRKELLVLQYSAQSYTNQEISAMLKVNINTIKFHKKNIFEKLNVNNSQEAITVASRLGLL